MTSFSKLHIPKATIYSHVHYTLSGDAISRTIYWYIYSYKALCTNSFRFFVPATDHAILFQEKACERAVGLETFMESGQCLEDVPGATITQELCLPSYEQITRHINTLADRTGVQHIFIASDIEPRLSYIRKKLATSVSNHLYSLAKLHPVVMYDTGKLKVRVIVAPPIIVGMWSMTVLL